mmetsp:Transcript_12172/g.44421  ORF Transcript_12172/g.44421 Transcript_12172/m.44421 type:complete len:495 (-) Transcript_12172:3662-5146(-)
MTASLARRLVSRAGLWRRAVRSRPLHVLNPFNGETVAHIAEASDAAVAETVTRAREVQKGWRKAPLEERVAVLNNFSELLQTECDLLARTLTSQTGKPISQARAEVMATRQRIGYYVQHASEVLCTREAIPEAANKSVAEQVRYEPLGVVANVSAWNYPFFTSANVFAAALVTGSAVIFKPSEYAAVTGEQITQLMVEAGLPSPHLMALCQGGPSTGQALVQQKLDGVFFTGSNKVGQAIAQAAAPRLTRIQLELGGKDPAYVRHDADPTQAATSLADGAFYNSGQSCCSVERIYVHRDIAAPFIERFVEVVNAFKIGDPTDESTYIGPITRPQHLAFLESQVQDALSKGAEIKLQRELPANCFYKDAKGSLSSGYFPPTVLTGVNHSMGVMKDESFGPVIGIQVVDSDEEALQLLDDTTYGLTAGVYTRDQAAAIRILEELEVGTGYWNCCDRVVARVPWSGRRSSGVGSTLGIEGLRSFVLPKAFHLVRAKP